MQTAAPDTVGFSMARLQRIDQVMERIVDRQQLSGIVTYLARHGQIVHLSCQGQMDCEAGRPMTDKTIFRIFSMTKPVTSVALMMLYEEGLVQLQDPVADYIPSFNGAKVFAGPGLTGPNLCEPIRPITIRDLLTHTSGLSYGFFEDSPVDALYREKELFSRELTLEETVERICRVPLIAQPGSRWRYSLSTDVVGRVVEVIAEQPLDEFFSARIFEPLGMVDTGFYVPPCSHDRLAVVYGKNGEQGLTPNEEITNRFREAPKQFSGGGGLVSTVHDYARFAEMLRLGGRGGEHGEQILGRKTLELMTRNHLHPELLPYQNGATVMHGYGFGLGFSVLLDPGLAQQPGSIGSYGWSGAATTTFWVDPVEDLVAIFLSQFMPIDPSGIMRTFRTLVYQALVD